MRELSFLLIAVACIPYPAYAQDKVSLNVVYEFTYVRDLADTGHPYVTDVVLSLGKNTSRYCSEKLYLNKTKKETDKKAPVQNSAPRPTVVVAGGPLLIVNKYGAIINEEVVKDITAEKMGVYANMGFKTYRLEDDLPQINWKILPDKKIIGKYNCQKATGSLGGRIYTAWFTTDLPFRDGPWKLSGLPGLILEARDQKNEVAFIYRSMNRNIDDNETTGSFLKNEGSIKTNMKSYLRTKEAFEKDPEAIMSAMAPNAKLAVRNVDDPDDKTARKIKEYNPLETY